ncbi:MAG: hypothetical protein LBR57_04300 [Alistipes sp.]|jgi:uncharacterized protein YdeI (BOF family)|nr:hypothetical protein [Alistipes sp.]
MKKLTALLAATSLVTTVLFSTGCDVDAQFQGVYNVYDIPVHPDEWQIARNSDGLFEYMYVDKAMAELNGNVFGRASYTTYFVYRDGNATVEVPLPHTVYGLEDGGYLWQYTIEAEYSPGYLRLKLAASDFKTVNVGDMVFRLAIVR